MNSSQWLSDLRQILTSVPLGVMCELVSLSGSQAVPEQYNQPTPISLGQMCIETTGQDGCLNPFLFVCF